MLNIYSKSLRITLIVHPASFDMLKNGFQIFNIHLCTYLQTCDILPTVTSSEANNLFRLQFVLLFTICSNKAVYELQTWVSIYIFDECDCNLT